MWLSMKYFGTKSCYSVQLSEEKDEIRAAPAQLRPAPHMLRGFQLGVHTCAHVHIYSVI